MGNNGAVLCLGLPLFVAGLWLYLLLYDNVERWRHVRQVMRWKREGF